MKQWTIVLQVPLSMGFSRQEYWNGLPFPSPEDLPDPGIEPRLPASQVDSLTTELPGKSYLPRRCGKEPTSDVVGQTEFPSVWHCLLGLLLVAFFNSLSHL